MASSPKTTIEAPEGYDILRILVGYNNDGELCCCEADETWDSAYTHGPDFEGEVQHIAFFVEKKANVRLKVPVHSFFLKDGKITVADPKEEECEREQKRNDRIPHYTGPLKGAW